MNNYGEVSTTSRISNTSRSRYVTAPLFLLIVLAVLWLYIEIGRIKLSALGIQFSTLASVVESNTSKISVLDKDIQNISSELSIVGALARNADMYAHSHGYSDSRLKNNVSSINNVLADVIKLRGVYFYWDTKQNPEMVNMPADKQIGFIAQEVEEVYPELVAIGPDGYKIIDYPKLTPLLVEAIKEQQVQISSLEQRNADLEERIQLLESLILKSKTDE